MNTVSDNENPTPEQEAPATLLFVDDESNILSSLRRVFRQEGYRILTATSGREGLQQLEQEKVDLVISDMRMPEMDGAAFLAEVARRWPDVVRILLTGYADLSSTITAINKGHIYSYFSKPWEDTEIRLAVQHALRTRRLEMERRRLLELTAKQNEELKAWNSTLEQRVEARTEELKQTNLFLELAYDQLKESYFESIPIFANLVQLREGAHAGHSKRVAELARDVARHMELDEEEVRHVYFAGLLHDVGKLGLPDKLLSTPYVKLNKEQRKLVDRHPVIGQGVLMGLDHLQRTAQFIRSHHETFDGRGYPDGLAGEDIALGARILMACNEYDQLRQGTLLGDDLSEVDTRAYLEERAGKRYDPDVVKALLEVLDARASGELGVRERLLEPEELTSGMRLSRDLISTDGVLLLSRGHVLNDILVEKIRAFAHDARAPLMVHVVAQEQKTHDNTSDK